MTEVRWICLCEVRPLQGNYILEGAAGAFVNAVAIGRNEDQCRHRVRGALQKYGFEVTDISNVREANVQSNELAPELVRLVGALTIEEPVSFDTFQTYED